MSHEISDPLGVASPKTPQLVIDEPDAVTRRGDVQEQEQIGTPLTPTPRQIFGLLGEDAMIEIVRSSERKRRRLDKYRDVHRALKGKFSHAAAQLLSGMESPQMPLPQSSVEKDLCCSPSPSKKAKRNIEHYAGPGLSCAAHGCPVCTTGDEFQRQVGSQFDGSAEDASRDAALKAAGYCPACDGQDPFASKGKDKAVVEDEPGLLENVVEERSLTFKCCFLCEGNAEHGKGKGKEIVIPESERPSLRGDLEATCCNVKPTECPAEHERQPMECCPPGEKDLFVFNSPACDMQSIAECCQDKEETVIISSDTTTLALIKPLLDSPYTPTCCKFRGSDHSQDSKNITEGSEKTFAAPGDEGNSYIERPVPGAFPFECGRPDGHEEASSGAEDINSFPGVPLFTRNLSGQKVRTIYGQLEKVSVEQVKDWAIASLEAASAVKKIQRECDQPDEHMQAVIESEKLPTNRKVASSSRAALIPPRSKSSGRKSSGFIAHDIPWKDGRVTKVSKSRSASREQAGSKTTVPKLSPQTEELDQNEERNNLRVPFSKSSPLRRKSRLNHGDDDHRPTDERSATSFNARGHEISTQRSEKHSQPREHKHATFLEPSGSGSNLPGLIIDSIDIPNTSDDAVVGAAELSSSSSDEVPLQFALPKPVSPSEVPPYPFQPSTIQPDMTKADLKVHVKATKALEKLAKKEAKKKEKLDKAAKKRGGNLDGPMSAAESEGQWSASPSPSEQRDSRDGEIDSAAMITTSEPPKQDSNPLNHPRPDPTPGDALFAEDLERIGQCLQPERPLLTEEDNERIRKKTDKTILAILVWVYFLQILDKSVLGYGSIFGLQNDNHLINDQYSLVGSIAPIAQLAWQPFSPILIVKVPHRILMPSLVLGWGIAQTAMAACHSFSGLLTTRFFLGLFEAGCLPLFGVITNQWYRRSEQPIRVAAWYGTNGAATIVASALSYGLGHIPSQLLRSWQIIFLFVGLLTIVSAPFVYWKIDNDVTSARFLTEHETIQAVERLRVNQTGIGSRKFEWSHVKEVALEPKTYLWIAMSLLVNVGASVTNTFGPLILSGFGFDKYKTSLLNIPFGFVQLIIILFSSYAAQKWKLKSAVLLLLVLPVIAGLVILYLVSRDDTATLLVGYYLLAFLFGSNPLIVSWIIGNTAGTTKKSVIMSLYNAGSSAGNIIGPLLFSSKDAPSYFHGLKAVLAIFATLAVVVVLQTGVLFVLNQNKERRGFSMGRVDC